MVSQYAALYLSASREVVRYFIGRPEKCDKTKGILPTKPPPGVKKLASPKQLSDTKCSQLCVK